ARASNAVGAGVQARGSRTEGSGRQGAGLDAARPARAHPDGCHGELVANPDPYTGAMADREPFHSRPKQRSTHVERRNLRELESADRMTAAVPGIFAAGDSRLESTRRGGFALGDGSLAVTLVHNLTSISA